MLQTATDQSENPGTTRARKSEPARGTDCIAEFEEFRSIYVECAAKIKPEQYGDEYCKKSVKFFACFVGDA